MQQTKENLLKGLIVRYAHQLEWFILQLRFAAKRSIGKETVCSHQRRIQIFMNIGRMMEMPQIIGEKEKYGEQHTQRGYLERTVGSRVCKIKSYRFLTGFLQ